MTLCINELFPFFGKSSDTGCYVFGSKMNINKEQLSAEMVIRT